MKVYGVCVEHRLLRLFSSFGIYFGDVAQFSFDGLCEVVQRNVLFKPLRFRFFSNSMDLEIYPNMTITVDSIEIRIIMATQ